jgi:hypothetical protein
MSASVEVAAPPRKRARKAEEAPECSFTWAGGFTPPVPAQVFKAAWDALARDLGRQPSAADLVDAARNRKHPLHGCFNWDVADAARAHWIEQAQGLIRHLRVVYSRGPVTNVPMRALFRVRIDGIAGYEDNKIVLTTPDLRRQVLREALRDLSSFVNKYAHLLTAIGADAPAKELSAALAKAAAD